MTVVAADIRSKGERASKTSDTEQPPPTLPVVAVYTTGKNAVKRESEQHLRKQKLNVPF